MPPFGHVSESDRAAVLTYVKTLSKALSDANRALCVSPPPAPPRSAALVGEGRQLYRLMRCASCHGASGRGDGPAAPALRDDAGRLIKPHDFVDISEYKCGNRDIDLFRTIQTGMSGTRMPSFVSALIFPSDAFPPTAIETVGSPAEVRDVAAYLSRQPTAAQLRSLDDAQTGELSNRRTWALVQYLRSLFGAAR
jgi:mono/diheme cytochrome c family protein